MHRALLALAVAGVTLASGVEAAHAAFPGANGRIAFAVEKWRLPIPCPPIPHGCEPELVSSSIETVLPNGRGRRVLRAFPAGDNGPGRVGTGLVAERQVADLRAGRPDRDHSPRTAPGCGRLPQLTNGEAQPTWSPDGRRLAFAGHTACCYWLYTVRARRNRSASGHRPARLAGRPGPRRARSRSSTTTTNSAGPRT